jgi:hypothetical protein
MGFALHRFSKEMIDVQQSQAAPVCCHKVGISRAEGPLIISCLVLEILILRRPDTVIGLKVSFKICIFLQLVCQRWQSTCNNIISSLSSLSREY